MLIKQLPLPHWSGGLKWFLRKGIVFGKRGVLTFSEKGGCCSFLEKGVFFCKRGVFSWKGGCFLEMGGVFLKWGCFLENGGAFRKRGFLHEKEVPILMKERYFPKKGRFPSKIDTVKYKEHVVASSIRGLACSYKGTIRMSRNKDYSSIKQGMIFGSPCSPFNFPNCILWQALPAGMLRPLSRPDG